MKVTLKTVEGIMNHHFGKIPKEVRELGGGRSNYVFEALHDNEWYVIRITDEQAKFQYFLKEQWAVQKVQENKVPVPDILEVGNDGSEFPYMIVRKVEGLRADTHPNRLEIIREMGKYTALINSIPTSGFGHVFDWSSNQLSRKETWKEYLEKELEFSSRLEVLEKNKVITNGHLSRLKSALKEVRSWTYKPTLSHGDMRLKNILVNEKGKITCILDWEMCCSNVAPYWDVAIALHDLSIDEKQAFVDGYGISPHEYRKLSNSIKALNIINYAPFVKTALEKKDKDKIEHIKSRLQGAYDLYSLDIDAPKKSRRWLPFKFGKGD